MIGVPRVTVNDPDIPQRPAASRSLAEHHRGKSRDV